jgi:hypothetical protein
VAAPIAALDVLGGANIASTGSSTTATALTTTGRVGVNVAAPIAALDVLGGANIASTGSSTTATALTTTGWVGVNKTPSVALDVAGAASISGNLNMNSNRIFGLPDSPTADNDATSKKYVDASINIVTAAITTALGINGTMSNNPSVYRNDNHSGYVYLAGVGVSGSNPPPIADDVTGRCNLLMEFSKSSLIIIKILINKKLKFQNKNKFEKIYHLQKLNLNFGFANNLNFLDEHTVWFKPRNPNRAEFIKARHQKKTEDGRDIWAGYNSEVRKIEKAD